MIYFYSQRWLVMMFLPLLCFSNNFNWFPYCHVTQAQQQQPLLLASFRLHGNTGKDMNWKKNSIIKSWKKVRQRSDATPINTSVARTTSADKLLTTIRGGGPEGEKAYFINEERTNSDGVGHSNDNFKSNSVTDATRTGKNDFHIPWLSNSDKQHNAQFHRRQKHHQHHQLRQRLLRSRRSRLVKQQQQQQQQKRDIRQKQRLKMYRVCTIIVLTWISSGTIFYSLFYGWPLSQAFFYAVDAGMSIGFCTEVAETSVKSRAFTIIFILLGSSCVGGASSLFLHYILERVDENSTREYKLLLERDAFRRADKDGTGVLSFEEFRSLMQQLYNDGHRDEQNQQQQQLHTLSDDELQRLWNKFDRFKTGVIRYEDFIGRYRGIHRLLRTSSALDSPNLFKRMIAYACEGCKIFWSVENRIYFVFTLWMLMGIAWGMRSQKWDIITSMHFAVSALATGGLTAPQVDKSTGILPGPTAIFCGLYCLFGIPLYYLTLGHFASVLVEGQIISLEHNIISTPLTKEEFEFAKHLCTATDSVVHLSDYIVLQFLRQGKINLSQLELIKKQFQLLDTDHSGVLTLKQATSITPILTTSPPTSTSTRTATKANDGHH